MPYQTLRKLHASPTGTLEPIHGTERRKDLKPGVKVRQHGNANVAPAAPCNALVKRFQAISLRLLGVSGVSYTERLSPSSMYPCNLNKSWGVGAQ